MIDDLGQYYRLLAHRVEWLDAEIRLMLLTTEDEGPKA